ncbi:MAG: Site-specific recombinase XerD [Cypionkella sp.]|uniref:phage integrase SAM-like domain-containing protein n=1 Tax=Cypionkella sp. TaxID=2811411 RepID=UPI00261C793E|nr:phage integrase SAM-like domain-containing protein [Cypionkella sp.]MDB5658015.1 Site-specific recombinase XerD [Cypionkella sp.]
MSSKKAKQSDLPRHVTKTVSGAYKYQRRVPKELQEFLRLEKWEHVLGSDPAEAYNRAHHYTEMHNGEIERFKVPEARAERDAFTDTMMAATLVEDAPPVDRWRETPTLLREARTLPKAQERDRLALFAAQAFGDDRYLHQRPANTHRASLTVTGEGLTLSAEPLDRATAPKLVPIKPPADPTDAIMFGAFKSALDTRLLQLPVIGSADTMRLSALMAQYAKAQGIRTNTAAQNHHRARRLIHFAGDLGLEKYDEPTLRRYRDYLVNGDPVAKPKPFLPIKAISVHHYFSTLKALWTWAADEFPEHRQLEFPRVRPPKNTATVESTRWQAFDDSQIKRVWELINVTWGPDGSSRLTPARRKCYLMAFRVLLHSGMRPSEVFRIKHGDITDGVLSIHYTKTTPRQIPLSSHLADFSAFLESGGFEAELNLPRPATPDSMAGGMTDSFTPIIRAGGLTSDRLVLYSVKDTLVDRLQRLEVSDSVIRGIIGHVTPGKLRHYKQSLSQSVEGMAQMRRALDAVVYW